MLINKLCEIEDLEWIRILYAYPEEVDDELIETIATNKKVCHYIDMPIQSGSDDILRRMGRRTTSQEIIALVEKLHRRIPDICIRTTLISGFPGETDADHENTMAFIDEIEFEIKKGTTEDLQKLRVELQKIVPLQEEARSKYARGLALVGKYFTERNT